MPASSKAQQRLMGLVKAVQAGDVPKSKVSKAVQKMADKMKEKDVDKYASTKHKGLPNKVQSEETLNENPAVIATAARMAIQNADGKKVSVNTARQPKYAKKDPGTHKKAKSIFQRIKDKFMKKDKPKKSAPKKQSKSDADFYAKRFGGKVEAVSALVEKSKPTNPSKWSYYKAQAKKKFDVYPSAYANAWAAKKYKAAGGGWKKESVELEEGQINEATYVKGKMNSIFNFSGKQLIDGLVGNVVDSPSVEQNRIKAQASKKAKAKMLATYLKFKKDIEKIVKPFDSEITGR